ncbi:MotA/TolQ/ExbB proton channel family protein [Arsukibacterium perlucidum]|uniref:MotA/TolQ/ExbB proton channel family protein n=1 Tax=Arsukibacterium perlucidum TaxID=368811 RepID=UPI00035FC9F2|nr:MotA/TolQ/ExbB proton channel family protein [Arsukibacterium perlucidum]
MMTQLVGLWESVQDFIHTGGNVLYVVAVVLFIMWFLMLERYWYVSAVFPKIKKDIIVRWDARADTTSWYAHKIRDTWISEATNDLDQRMLLIKTLVAMCPLVGLLGTVTGMIAVFDIMATQGTGNPRTMAAGISMATIPTMAGMVAALSGLFFSSRLETKVKREKADLVDSLPHH